MFIRNLSAPRINTLLGKGASVSGDVEFEGALHLDWHIAGNVRSDDAPGSTLTVSESGSIQGDVQVPNVELQGTIKGDIYARERLVLSATACVEGNVYYGAIEMTVGAQIMGRLVRLEPEAPVPAVGLAG